MSETKYTRENPGCRHAALKYASEMTGIPTTKEIRVDSIDALYRPPHRYAMRPKIKLKYKSRDITVMQLDGTTCPFFENNERFDRRGAIAAYFIVKVRIGLGDFGVTVVSRGQYTDSLGGGWSQKVQLYSIGDRFFADMQCTCF